VAAAIRLSRGALQPRTRRSLLFLRVVRSSTPVHCPVLCSALLVFSKARDGQWADCQTRGISTAQAVKRTRGDAFSLQRAMSSRGASLSLLACLLADGFACGCGGTARHGARVTHPATRHRAVLLARGPRGACVSTFPVASSQRAREDQRQHQQRDWPAAPASPLAFFGSAGCSHATVTDAPDRAAVLLSVLRTLHVP
jgi:hypothetical protein